MADSAVEIVATPAQRDSLALLVERLDRGDIKRHKEDEWLAQISKEALDKLTEGRFTEAQSMKLKLHRKRLKDRVSKRTRRAKPVKRLQHNGPVPVPADIVQKMPHLASINAQVAAAAAAAAAAQEQQLHLQQQQQQQHHHQHQQQDQVPISRQEYQMFQLLLMQQQQQQWMMQQQIMMMAANNGAAGAAGAPQPYQPPMAMQDQQPQQQQQQQQMEQPLQHQHQQHQVVPSVPIPSPEPILPPEPVISRSQSKPIPCSA